MMYAKLALRNAKRSVKDYMLYMTTLTILIAIMAASNLLTAASSTQYGIQAGSLPLLISIVLVILLNYINDFMLRQRAKEFATYILLGMERNMIATLFFMEYLLLGIVCFISGIFIGGTIFSLFLIIFNSDMFIIELQAVTFLQAVFQTLLYFCLIEAATLLWSKRRIKKLQINQLMSESRRNEKLKGRRWAIMHTIIFTVSLIAYVTLLMAITKGSNLDFIIFSVSIIAMPLLLSIFSFYKALFYWLAVLRKKKNKGLYHGDSLYLIAQMLSKANSNATLNALLSMCLIFSAISFVFGSIMLMTTGALFPNNQRLWMGYAQISICIIFIVIYFSVLAMRQVVDFRANSFGFKIMYHLGKTRQQLNSAIAVQVCLIFFIPAIMCILLLGCAVAPINQILNLLIPAKNIIITAIGQFTGCFIILYAGYLLVAYKTGVKYTRV